MASQNPGASSELTETLQALGTRNFAALGGRRVLVIGDVMLDRYLWGSVARTASEAPVPVVRHEETSDAPGGAANVAANILSLGGQVDVVSVAGDDEDGRILLRRLEVLGIGARSVLHLPGRPTTLKTRIISMGQQLLRIDHEDVSPLPEEVTSHLVRHIRRLVPKCQSIVLSDYLKGVLSDAVIAATLEAAREHGTPVLVDYKGHDYRRYRGADILTPNQREAARAAGSEIHTLEDLEAAGRLLLKRSGVQALVITRGAEGIAVLRRRRPLVAIPARAREVFDDTGAGDTAIATLALATAAGLELDTAAALANYAGGVVCGKLGVAAVSLAELRAAVQESAFPSKVRTVDEMKTRLADLRTRGRRIIFTNGCFDLLHPGHLQFLHQSRQLGDVLVVGLNTDRSVRALKGPRRPILPQDERASILSALQVVDYIVFFDELTPETILRELRPDVLTKGRNIPEDQVVGREIVQSYGGEVVRLPTLHDRTVSDLVDSIVGKFDRRTTGSDGSRG